MHLESLDDQIVRVAGRSIGFRRGETIHTESSHKFTAYGFASLAAQAGWQVARSWRDPQSPVSEILPA